MNANVVVSNEFMAEAREAVRTSVGWMDESAKVRLVTAVFDPKNGAGFPAGAAGFPVLDATDAWQLEYDATTQKFYLVAPDPAEGWDFISTAGGFSIVGFVVVSGIAASPIGGNVFETPIPVGAAGEHINLPWVTVDVTQIVMDAMTPYALP